MKVSASLPAIFLAAALAAPAAALNASWSIDDGPWTAARSVSPRVGQRLRLRVPEEPGASIRWYQIIPDVTAMYKNADAPAKIRYDREELTKFRGRWEIELFAAGRPARPGDWTDAYASPIARSPYYHSNVGTFWFQAVVEKDGRATSTPGVDPARGLDPAALRASVRAGPGPEGYLSSFFNVPAVFGSIPRQSNGYQGVDCADVLTASAALWSGSREERNLNVATLAARLRNRGQLRLSAGKPSKPLRWGQQVFPADWVAVRYEGAKSYQHIGMLIGDDGNGILDGGDAVLHAGPRPLAYAKLGEGRAFEGSLIVLRPPYPIVDTPIPRGPSREAATARYIAEHYGEGPEAAQIEPEMIVLHWTGLKRFGESLNAFIPEFLPPSRRDIASGGPLNVSAHFLVDRGGEIHRLMPENRMARHVIGLNLSAIGIENVGGADGRDDLTPAQARANAWLVRELKERYPGIAYLIGHHESTRFAGTALWKERQREYWTLKPDPGDAFMGKVRAQVFDLGLKGPPN